MLIKNKKKSDLPESDLTPESIYQSRRDLIKKLGLGTALLPIAAQSQANIFDFLFSNSEDKKTTDHTQLFQRQALQFQPSSFGKNLVLTPEEKVLTYNNFYEFGASKEQPFENSQGFKVDPWSLSVSGLVNKPFTLGYEDLLSLFPLEERRYRMRCVEAWSMNIPWIGFPLSALIKRADPLGKAKFVAFQTIYDPKQMIGQRNPRIGGGISFPYVEGLRIDEAMNPLTILSVGLYGKTLAPQNGAPIRLVVPWKYGFKGIKSIVKIELVEEQPPTTWQSLAADEYGFYANVNPDVDHPRWSQGSERFIGEGGIFSSKRQPTLPFNGYAEEVASLYSGMNLKRNY